MKKNAMRVCLCASVALGWAQNVYALNVGGNIELGIGQFLALIAVNIIALFVASKIMDFEQPDFWRAVSSSLGIGAILFLMLVFTGDSKLSTIGLVIVAVIAIVLIQRVYNTTLGKTLGAFLIAAVATAIASTALSGAF